MKSNDSYEDDDFEEASLSKSNQGPAKPLTKFKSAKRQSRGRKSMELSSEKTSERKYSPIRESKRDEEDSQSSQYTSV